MMLSSLLSLPFNLIPKPVTAVTMGIVMNLFFKRYPDFQERLKELAGKTFEFHVEDLDQSYFMEVNDEGQVLIHTYSDSLPHVVMSGSKGAFLSLLFATSDPDSLFFSRELKLSGETDTGLRFKNILDNVEIDWEKELTVLFGTTTARLLMSLATQVKQAGEQGKKHLESELEQWFAGHNIPRQDQFNTLRQQSEALVKNLERMEGRMTRAAKRLAMTGTSQTGKTQKID